MPQNVCLPRTIKIHQITVVIVNRVNLFKEIKIVSVSVRVSCLVLCMLLFWLLKYKKLRYREEHSASVVLSWCTL